MVNWPSATELAILGQQWSSLTVVIGLGVNGQLISLTLARDKGSMLIITLVVRIQRYVHVR